MDTPVRSVEGQVRKRLNNIETETSVEDQVRKRRLNNVETETCDRLVLEAILPAAKNQCAESPVKDASDYSAVEEVLSSQLQSSDTRAAEADSRCEAPVTSLSETRSEEHEQCKTRGEKREMDFTMVVMSQEKNFPSLAFTLAVDDESEEPVVVINQRRLANHPPCGLVSRAQITIKRNKYSVNVLKKEWDAGELHSQEEVSDLCRKFAADTKYKFCPGLDPDHYQQEYFEKIRFHLKSVRCTDSPFRRVDSVNCAMWFLLAPNAKAAEKGAKEVKCPACKRLVTDLNCQRRRTLSESPGRKVKRQNPSSRARLSYMSPASQQKRKKRTQVERSNDKLKLAKCRAAELDLSDEQNDDMCNISETIEATQRDELDKLFAEGDAHGVGGVLKNIWEMDRSRQRDQFLRDQATNTSGKKGNKWSMITIRIALAVFTRSPAAYEALKSFKILQLPSRSTLQSYTGAFLHEPGASSKCIEDQVANFTIYKEECIKDGKKEPKGDGVLIFDEVKVACQLIWNSRSQKLMGLAMTHDEQASLLDVYKYINSSQASQQTSYILQFLWRDLTSSYDIVGPYYTSAASVENTFIASCVFETIKLFQCHGLKTSLLVCDGAASNLSTIKATHSHSGAYGIKKEVCEDKFDIKPWMMNPYNPPHKIYWMICPTHQLKNMVNALFSSKTDGTKQFQREGHPTFGWQAILDMYQRELERASKQIARMVPRLKEAYCLRDAWTKLNVAPSKIMQQEQVLGELYWYTHQDPPPDDAESVSETLKYLEACSLLFEKGFLSHNKVDDLNCEVLKNIEKGYKYYSDWISGILQKDPDFPHTANTQRVFLSWQTWDLLRIDVYSFKAFCKWFLSTYPGHFVSPLRISGSAVESIFSQYKRIAGGKLDSVNYCTSRCAHLIQQCVAPHHSGKDCRDQTTSFIELPLVKKQYNKVHKPL